MKLKETWGRWSSFTSVKSSSESFPLFLNLCDVARQCRSWREERSRVELWGGKSLKRLFRQKNLVLQLHLSRNLTSVSFTLVPRHNPAVLRELRCSVSSQVKVSVVFRSRRIAAFHPSLVLWAVPTTSASRGRCYSLSLTLRRLFYLFYITLLSSELTGWDQRRN